MGSAIAALISGWTEGERAKRLSDAEDDRQDMAFRRMIDMQDDRFELFKGAGFAQDLIESIISGGGEGEILNWLFQPPVKMTAGEKREYGLFQEGEPMMNEIRGMLEGLRPTAQNLVDTGFRTDMQPIVDAELRRLNTQTAPGLAERFGGAISGSGFENALASAAGDVSTFLGEKQAGLDEAAANRRITGLNIAPEIFANPLNLQTGFAEALGSAGERFRLRKEATRASNVGAKLLSALTGLSQIEQGQGFVMPGFPGQNPAAGGFGGMASAIPGLVSGASSLIQSLFGGGSGTGNNYGSIFNTGNGVAGIDYNAGGIAGTGVTDAEFDQIFANSGSQTTASNQTTLGGGFLYG